MKNEALEYDFFIFATISACGKLSGNEVPQTTRFVGNPNKPALVISHSILFGKVSKNANFRWPEGETQFIIDLHSNTYNQKLRAETERGITDRG